MKHFRKVLAVMSAAAIIACQIPITVQPVTVYADETLSTETPDQPVQDESTPPELTVEISEDWKNDVSDWKVTAEDGAVICYKISDKSDLSETMPDGCSSWEGEKSFKNIPEGERYIRFWAYFKDRPEKTAASEIKKYKLDKTAPNSFEIERKSTFWSINNDNFTVVNKKDLSDSVSGIKTIYYSISNGENGELTDDQIRRNGSKVAFSFNVGGKMKDDTITVTAVDHAGNETSASLDGNYYDSNNPLLKGINIITSEDPTDTENNKTYSFCVKDSSDSDTKNGEYVYFANKESYVEIVLNDDEIHNDTLTLRAERTDTDTDSGTDTSSDTDTSKDTDSEKPLEIKVSDLKYTIDEGSSKGLDSKDYKIYVPIGERSTDTDQDNNKDSKKDKNTLQLIPGVKYKLTAEVKDTAYNGTTKKTLKGSVLLDIKEPNITVTSRFGYTPASRDIDGIDEMQGIDRVFDDNKSQLDFNFSNSTGLARYSISVNGTEEKNVDLSKGNKIKDSDTAKTSSDTDTDNATYHNEVITTKNETIDLSARIDKGEKRFTILARTEDLAGNKADKEYRCIVDSGAPVIKPIDGADYKYSMKNKSLLSFLSFGIFGNSTMSLEVCLFDEQGVGVDPDSVKFELMSGDDSVIESFDHTNTINSKDVDVENGNVYTFEIPLNRDNARLEGIPSLVFADYLGRISRYFFASADEGKLTKLDADGMNGAVLVLENSAPTIVFDPIDNGNGKVIVQDDKLYFGDDSDSKIYYYVNDDVAVENYSITISPNDFSKVCVDTDVSDISSSTGRVKSHASTLDISSLDTGVYYVAVRAADLSGNESSKLTPGVNLGLSDTNANYLVVDKDAPVIRSLNYSIDEGYLKYFSFGIFSNQKVRISLEADDNEYGIGVETVMLCWNSEDSASDLISGKEISEGRYEFTLDLPKEESVPSIIVTDRLGNSHTYFFKTVKEGMYRSVSDKPGDLMLEGEGDGAAIVLENTPPVVNIAIPKDYKKYTIAGEEWYADDISYIVEASDALAGLHSVKVTEEGKETVSHEENTAKELNGSSFIDSRYTGETSYTYKVTKADKYKISVAAEDNAENINNEQSYLFNIDKEDPQIKRFVFGTNEDMGSTVEKDTYGYFFMYDTEVRVYVLDPGVTSDIKGVTLFLKNVGTNTDGTVENVSSFTVSGSQLEIDTGGRYAKFVIPQGFKGQVAAEVADNVEHTSGIINADGNVVENDDLHKTTSNIVVEEESSTTRKDAAGVPLYNESIPLAVTVTDTFSGISKIEWSIKDDEKSGTITVDVTGKIEAGAVKITDQNEDSNLITMLKFGLTVNSNTNGNVVTIKLTDRSGNTSVFTKTYSIDTTSPRVSSVYENNNAGNGNFYNADQIVAITIVERNFDPDRVSIVLNGSELSVSWDDNGSEVGSDSTEHHAKFVVGADGVYSYSISCEDRADNESNTDGPKEFVIDKTRPVISLKYSTGDDSKDNAYYNTPRTITIDVNEHNFDNAKLRITRNGDDVTGEFPLKWDENSETDKRSRSVNIDKNGYYEVSVEVKDKAGNSYEASSKNFYIDLNAPLVSINVDNVENGSASNEETISPIITIKDEEGNLDTSSITLVITENKLNDNHEIVTEHNTIKGLDNLRSSELGTVSVDDDSKTNEVTFRMNNIRDDGIYKLNIVAKDLAGNEGGAKKEEKEAGSEYKLSVNRQGSTYEVDALISDVDPSMRYYRNNEESPFGFTIREYNVNKLNAKDTIVKMTCDGTIVNNSIKAVENNSNEEWGEYVYEFPSDLMTESGKYIVKLYSVDAAGNRNPLEINGESERATVTFFIDNIAPEVYFRDANDKSELTSEDPYVTDNKHIEVEIYDNSQQPAQDISFELNGEKLDVQHIDGTMLYSFDMPSKNSSQDLMVTVSDIAGNTARIGVDDILITRNALVLWVSNTPVFIASIASFAVLVGLAVFLTIKMKKKQR